MLLLLIAFWDLGIVGVLVLCGQGRLSPCFCPIRRTGTLTSDQMVAVGMVNAGTGKEPKETAVNEASTMACVVLAGCHSLPPGRSMHGNH